MIQMIVALSTNNVIAKDGVIPWKLPSDMERFKEITMGHSVIMGRKTYESLPEKFRPLPGRENIILTRDKKYDPMNESFVAHTWDSALGLATKKEIFVIGGSDVYKLALPFAKKIHYTMVKIEIEGDNLTFFPKIDILSWSRESFDRIIDKRDQYPSVYKVMIKDRVA